LNSRHHPNKLRRGTCPVPWGTTLPPAGRVAAPKTSDEFHQKLSCEKSVGYCPMGPDLCAEYSET
jgi:hypothetical protein